MNARNATPNDGRAGVNTGDVPQREDAPSPPPLGWPGLRNSHARVTARIKGRMQNAECKTILFCILPFAFCILFDAAETTDEVDHVPRVGIRELSFQAFHLVLGRRAVLDNPEDLAFARAAGPSLVGETRGLHVLRRHRAVAGAGVAVAEPAEFRVERLAGFDRGR